MPRARLIHSSTPKTCRDPWSTKQWIRPRRATRPPAPKDVAEVVEFCFDGNALHVDGCQPLRT